MRLSPLVLAAVFVAAGCEDGPEQIFEPNTGDITEQNGFDKGATFTAGKVKGWDDTGGDAAGSAKFCDEDESQTVIEWMVVQPIVADTSVGGIQMWREDGSPAIADDFVGKPADLANPGTDQKFCDPWVTYYINAYIWGPSNEVIIIFDPDTRLMSGFVALPGYLGAMQGQYTTDIGSGAKETVRIRPREYITFLDDDGNVAEELDVYNPADSSSWLNPVNVNRYYRMVREGAPFNDDPANLNFDCVDAAICDILYTATDETREQPTVVMFNDSGVTLEFTPDGTVDWFWLEAVRIQQFELDGEVSFDGTAFSDHDLQNNSLAMQYTSRHPSVPNCTFNLEEELTWAGFKTRCDISANAEKRLIYDVYDSRDMVSVGFQTLSFDFQRDVIANPILLDGERPGPDDILTGVSWSRTSYVDIEEFTPNEVAALYLQKLDSRLQAAVCAPGECPAGSFDPSFHLFADPVGEGLIPDYSDPSALPVGDEPQRMGEMWYDRVWDAVRQHIGEGSADLDDSTIDVLRFPEERSILVNSIEVFADGNDNVGSGDLVGRDNGLGVIVEANGSGLTGEVDYATGLITLEENGTDDIWPLDDAVYVDYETTQQRSWVPDIVESIRDAYVDLPTIEKMMLDPAIADPVNLIEPINDAVLDIFTYGEGIAGPGKRTFRTFWTREDRRFSSGGVDFFKDGELYNMQSHYAFNYGAVTTVTLARGTNHIDDIFDNLNVAANQALGENNPFYSIHVSKDSELLDFVNPLGLGGDGVTVHGFDRELNTLDVTIRTVTALGLPGTSVTTKVLGYPRVDQNGYYKQIGGQTYEFVPADIVVLEGRAGYFAFYVEADGRIGRILEGAIKGRIELCDDLWFGYGDDLQAGILEWKANVPSSAYLNCELIYNYSENGNVLNSIASIANKTSISVEGGRVRGVWIWR